MADEIKPGPIQLLQPEPDNRLLFQVTVMAIGNVAANVPPPLRDRLLAELATTLAFLNKPVLVAEGKLN